MLFFGCSVPLAFSRSKRGKTFFKRRKNVFKTFHTATVRRCCVPCFRSVPLVRVPYGRESFNLCGRVQVRLFLAKSAYFLRFVLWRLTFLTLRFNLVLPRRGGCCTLVKVAVFFPGTRPPWGWVTPGRQRVATGWQTHGWSRRRSKRRFFGFCVWVNMGHTRT